MRGTTWVAGLSVLVFGVAGLAVFALVLVPPSLGYEDTDDPALMLSFARTYPRIFVLEGMAMLVMGISLVVGTVAIGEAISRPANAVAVRSASVFGLFAALCFFLGGALRVQAGGPVVHMADLDPTWGEAAYLAVQVAAQALLISALFMVGIWSVGIAVIGHRVGLLPDWVAALAVVPAMRAVLGTLALLGLLPDIGVFWLLSLVAIPGTMVWALLLGVVLLRRWRSEPPGSPATDALPVPGEVAGFTG